MKRLHPNTLIEKEIGFNPEVCPKCGNTCAFHAKPVKHDRHFSYHCDVCHKYMGNVSEAQIDYLVSRDLPLRRTKR